MSPMTPPPMIVTRLPSRLVKDHAPCPRSPASGMHYATWMVGGGVERAEAFVGIADRHAAHHAVVIDGVLTEPHTRG